MRLNKVVMLAALAMAASAFAVQRTVVVEKFTATWCTYCPGAAGALAKLMGEVGDSLVAVAYHPSSSGDPFYNDFSGWRMNYYGSAVGGYPTTIWDGTVPLVGGNHNPNDPSMYTWYRQEFNTRKTIAAPVTLEVGGSMGGSGSTTGQIKARITNKALYTMDATVQIAVIENNIKYAWENLDTLQEVVRAMLPDQNGQDVSIPSGSSGTVSAEFTLDPGWNKNNCEIVVFVQKQGQAGPLPVYQGWKVKVTDMKPLDVDETRPLAVRVVGVSPNPFRNLTTVTYFLSHAQTVHAKVMDAAGSVVATVVDGARPAGDNRVSFSGNNLTPGVYFLSLGTKEATTVTKLIVVK